MGGKDGAKPSFKSEDENIELDHLGDRELVESG